VLAGAEPKAAASGSEQAVGWGRVPAGLRETKKRLGLGEATAAATALAPAE
jgi:hypothetical protein